MLWGVELALIRGTICLPSDTWPDTDTRQNRDMRWHFSFKATALSRYQRAWMFLGVEEDKCLVETRTQGKKEGEENGITKAGTATKYQLVPNHFRIALLPGQLTCPALWILNIFIILKIGYWISCMLNISIALLLGQRPILPAPCKVLTLDA